MKQYWNNLDINSITIFQPDFRLLENDTPFNFYVKDKNSIFYIEEELQDYDCKENNDCFYWDTTCTKISTNPNTFKINYDFSYINKDYIKVEYKIISN